jgi:hypothetical protein
MTGELKTLKNKGAATLKGANRVPCDISLFVQTELDQHYPALPVSRDIKGEAATAAAISIGS